MHFLFLEIKPSLHMQWGISDVDGVHIYSQVVSFLHGVLTVKMQDIFPSFMQ